MLFDNLYKAFPTFLQYSLLTSLSAGNRFLPRHSILLLLVAGRLIKSILGRRVFINTCIHLEIIFVFK